MLYQFYDWQRTAMEPWRKMAEMANEFYGHSLSPFSYLPGSRNVAAAFDLVGRLTQRYDRPEFGFGKVRVGDARVRGARRSTSSRGPSAACCIS